MYTVAELIEKLKEFPPDLTVCIPTRYHDFHYTHDINFIGVKTVPWLDGAGGDVLDEEQCLCIDENYE